MYKVRCYTNDGDFSHEKYFDMFEDARKYRTEWGLSIGLKPEPSDDFAYYPTVWRERENGTYERIRGL